jgi:hypothetical protein
VKRSVRRGSAAIQPTYALKPHRFVDVGSRETRTTYARWFDELSVVLSQKALWRDPNVS